MRLGQPYAYVIGSAPGNRAEKGTALTLRELVNKAIGKLREWHEDNPENTEPQNTIFEIAYSRVPVNFHELLRLAGENIALATDSEYGPANGCNFDGTLSPVNLIAGNVIEHIEQALWDAWNEMKNEEVEDEAAA